MYFVASLPVEYVRVAIASYWNNGLSFMRHTFTDLLKPSSYTQLKHLETYVI